MPAGYAISDLFDTSGVLSRLMGGLATGGMATGHPSPQAKAMISGMATGGMATGGMATSPPMPAERQPPSPQSAGGMATGLDERRRRAFLDAPDSLSGANAVRQVLSDELRSRGGQPQGGQPQEGQPQGGHPGIRFLDAALGRLPQPPFNPDDAYRAGKAQQAAPVGFTGSAGPGIAGSGIAGEGAPAVSREDIDRWMTHPAGLRARFVNDPLSTPVDLRQKPIVISDDGSNYRSAFAAAGASLGVKPQTTPAERAFLSGVLGGRDPGTKGDRTRRLPMIDPATLPPVNSAGYAFSPSNPYHSLATGGRR
jgi:hypothetical protein